MTSPTSDAPGALILPVSAQPVTVYSAVPFRW